METIVVDTDCGVDDAMAMLLALGSTRRAQVIGVTCCFGNTTLENAVANVKRVLELCGRTEVPLYRGCKGPLLTRPRRDDPTYHCVDGFGGVSGEFPTGGLQESPTPASVALVQLTLEQPDVITLLAIGPLTNVALAHRIDPDFTSRLKRLVIMGGNYKGEGNTTEKSEFNFHCDPEAADIVLGEAHCPITLVPCAEFGFTFDHYDRMCLVSTKKGDFYRKATKVLVQRARQRNKKFITDCDLLAVVAALYPEGINGFLDSPMAVETEGRYCRAEAVLFNHPKSLNDHGRKNVRIVTSLDRDLVDRLRLAMLRDEPVDV